MHRLANVLDKLPKRLQPKAKQALHAIMQAPTRAEAETGIEAFVAEYDAKYPKAVVSLRRDQPALLTFFDFPVEHWRHLRTTNRIALSTSTVCRVRSWSRRWPASPMTASPCLGRQLYEMNWDVIVVDEASMIPVASIIDPIYEQEPEKPFGYVGEGVATVLLRADEFSGLTVSISNRHWQDSDPDDRRPWIAPHLPVPLTSEDWRANRDPVLDAVWNDMTRQAGPARRSPR